MREYTTACDQGYCMRVAFRPSFSSASNPLVVSGYPCSCCTLSRYTHSWLVLLRFARQNVEETGFWEAADTTLGNGSLSNIIRRPRRQKCRRCSAFGKCGPSYWARRFCGRGDCCCSRRPRTILDKLSLPSPLAATTPTAQTRNLFVSLLVQMFSSLDLS